MCDILFHLKVAYGQPISGQSNGKVFLRYLGYSSVYDVRALQNSDPSDVIYTSGCIEQGEVWVNHNLIPVAGVFVGLALVQVGI